MQIAKRVTSLVLVSTLLASTPLVTNAASTTAVTIYTENEFQTFRGWLGVKNGTMTDNNNIDQYDYHGYENQQWRFEETGL